MRIASGIVLSPAPGLRQAAASWPGRPVEEDFAVGCDLCATVLIKAIAIISQLHTGFASRRKCFPADPAERTYCLVKI
jgi:hypothetical protein